MELSSMDAQPPFGSLVRDADGHVWERFDPDDAERVAWCCISEPDDDVRSWTRLAGNHGPVVVLRVGPDPELERMRAIVERLADLDPRGFDSMEERICAICRGEETYRDTVHPAAVVIVEHDASWIGHDGKLHGHIDRIAHEPDCLWLAAKAACDPATATA